MAINMDVNEIFEVDTNEIFLKVIKLNNDNPESFLSNF